MQLSGHELADMTARHVALARHDWIGGLDCRVSLDHLEVWSARSLVLLDDGMLTLGPTVAAPEPDDDRCWPHENPVLVVLDVSVELLD